MITILFYKTTSRPTREDKLSTVSFVSFINKRHTFKRNKEDIHEKTTQ